MSENIRVITHIERVCLAQHIDDVTEGTALPKELSAEDPDTLWVFPAQKGPFEVTPDGTIDYTLGCGRYIVSLSGQVVGKCPATCISSDLSDFQSVCVERETPLLNG